MKHKTTRTDINEQGLRHMWTTDGWCSGLTSEGGNQKRVSGNDIVISPQDIFAEFKELHNGYRITTAKFESCGQFVDQVDRMLKGKTAHTANGGTRKSWVFGDQNITSTRQHVKDGTPCTDGIVREYQALKTEVDKYMTCDAQMSKCVSARRKRKKSWGGGNITVNRVLESRASGKPMPCFNQHSRRADRPVIRIGMRISMTYGGDAHDFARVSAMCAVLAERFEMMGYGVEIWGMCVSRYSREFDRLPNGDKLTNEHNGRWACNMWQLKSADERIDVMRCMSQGMSGIMRCFNSNAVMLVHGGASIECGTSPDLPEEIVEHLKLDVSVERSWSRGSKQEQALRISGKIKEVLQPTA